MTNMLCNTDEMSMSFPCVGRKVRIIMTVVNLFPKVKTEKRADVIGGSSKLLYRNSIDRIAKGVIKDKNNIQKT